MSTAATTPATTPATTQAPGPAHAAVTDTATRDARRPAPSPIPFSRLLLVEARKMVDTRAGLWLMVGIAVASVLASAAVVLWAPDSMIDYSSFSTAIGIPMAVMLPIIAILSVTSEFSQRTGLATFTLVPHRGRVVAAKLVNAVAVGVLGMVVAAGVGALGNLVGAALVGIDPVWDVSFALFSSIVLGNVLGVLVGFMLATLLRSTPAAMVGYLVYGYVLVGLTTMLASVQEWFADAQPWVDFNFHQGNLFEGFPETGEGWAQLGVTAVVWLVVPLALGLWRLVRAEVK
ncbi:ABC transporter permease subunit [Nocardioides bruguierae]|uniref:ABC transporter permease n=1 Tax=Nocardioides bruguierae TaxID=2945102 RepID=A0A9X2IDY2_9ACTN|nr:ABC transporter permease subunit [Nocardioides bruguierae]MCL8026534.1 ABC transporter permease [Nocardioides bruguierae]MCM0619732.1 ABC transporter permease [Nocardioides bruguierae]